MSNLTPLIGEAVTFDASGSSDPDGTIAAYAWQFGDGGASADAVASHTYSTAGSMTYSLTVTDNEGASGSATGSLTVLAEPPRLTVSPLSGTVQPGTSQTITVSYDAVGQVQGTFNGQLAIATNGGNLTIPVGVMVSATVAVEGADELPARSVLHQNYPNPFNPSTSVRYELDGPGSLELAVFDITGRKIRVLEQRTVSPGSHEAVWNGTDSAGRLVSSGTYLIRLVFQPADARPPTRLTRKVTLLK